MTNGPIAFEQLVERIHRLLESMDAAVSWNDRIADPDNASQGRQIDITIRRGTHLTLVECRLRRTAQDVTWIEELIGRRESLNAQAVVAVSASGFTRGASAKAERFGIVLRDFASLSGEEVLQWGASKKFELRFIEFTDASLRFVLPRIPAPPYRIVSGAGKLVRDYRLFFQNAAKAVQDDERLARQGTQLQVTVPFQGPFHINGEQAIEVVFRAKLKRIKERVALSSVVAYSDARRLSSPEAFVGSLELGATEIIEAAGRYSMIVDLSQVRVPPQCMFESLQVDFGSLVKVREIKGIGAAVADPLDVSLDIQFALAAT